MPLCVAMTPTSANLFRTKHGNGLAKTSCPSPPKCYVTTQQFHAVVILGGVAMQKRAQIAPLPNHDRRPCLLAHISGVTRVW